MAGHGKTVPLNGGVAATMMENDMTGSASQKTWAQLKKVIFSDCLPPRNETHKAINVLRELPKQVSKWTNSNVFFKWVAFKALEDDPPALGEIICDDVVYTLRSLNAPPLPKKVMPVIDDPDEKYLKYPYSKKTASNWLQLAKSENHIAMLVVVSRCFRERASMIRDRFLQDDSDWWIRMAINDVDLGMILLHGAANLPEQELFPN